MYTIMKYSMIQETCDWDDNFRQTPHNFGTVNFLTAVANKIFLTVKLDQKAKFNTLKGC